MTDRFNTIAGWTLFAGIIALGLSIVSGMYFQADKPHRPEQMGFPIEGVVEEGAADEGPPLATLMALRRGPGREVFAKCTRPYDDEQGVPKASVQPVCDMARRWQARRGFFISSISLAWRRMELRAKGMAEDPNAGAAQDDSWARNPPTSQRDLQNGGGPLFPSPAPKRRQR